MARKSPKAPDSGSDSENSSSSSENLDKNGGEATISEYEQQRLSRIKENKARLEALGLSSLSSSLLASIQKQHPDSKAKLKTETSKSKQIRKGDEDEDDDEYRPSEGEEDDPSSSSDDDSLDQAYTPSSLHPSLPPKGKGRSPSSAAKLKKKLPVQRDVNELHLVDDDVLLQQVHQAIALSLDGSQEEFHSMPGVSQNSAANKKGIDYRGRQDGIGTPEATQKRKRRKTNANQVQLTEDEVLAYFLSFDDAGKGAITIRDLRRVAEAHDFTWTDKELIDMINCFDSDRDGMLNLSDFRSIVARCNMMRRSEDVEAAVKC